MRTATEYTRHRGLNDESTTTRIEAVTVFTSNRVCVVLTTNPLQQGLKQPELQLLVVGDSS